MLFATRSFMIVFMGCTMAEASFVSLEVNWPVCIASK